MVCDLNTCCTRIYSTILGATFLNERFTDICKSDDIRTFEMSTNQNSRFFIANQLWKLM